MNRLIAAALLLFVLVPSAHAWSAKEHVMMTRVAVRNLLASEATPPEMKAWLMAAQPDLGSADDERVYLLTARMGVVPRGVDGLAYWSVMPDLIADSASGKQKLVEPFKVPEGSLHYLDLEYFMPNEADRTYSPDLSHLPALSDISRDMADPRWQKAGMLPFRIEGCFNEMVSAIRAGRLVDRPGQFPRDDHATQYAGLLAHYAADNCMPLHATVDYQCYSYFANASRKPRVHFDMEFRLTDDDKADYPELREKFWQAFTAAIAESSPTPMEGDPWTTSVRQSMLAYEAIPAIGNAAQRAYLDPAGNVQGFDAHTFFRHEQQVGGFGDQPITIIELKARSMARGIRWIERLWLEAWQQAQRQPALPATGD